MRHQWISNEILNGMETSNSNKFWSGISPVPYLRMSLYIVNMTSRSRTPVVCNTVDMHFLPATSKCPPKKHGKGPNRPREEGCGRYRLVSPPWICEGRDGNWRPKNISDLSFSGCIPFIERNLDTLRKVFFNVQHRHYHSQNSPWKTRTNHIPR